MNTIQKNKLLMYDELVVINGDHITEVESVEGLKNSNILLKSTTLKIHTTLQDQELVITGLAKEKALARDASVVIFLTVINGVAAWAHSAGQSTVEDEMKISRSRLQKMRQNDFVTKGFNVHTVASAHVADIADFGVSAATLASFKDSLTLFQNKIPTVKLARDLRMTYTAKLKVLFKTNDDNIRNEMDRLVKVLPDDTCAEYKKLYFNGRSIYDYNAPKNKKVVKTATVRGKASNSIDGKPLEGALLYFKDATTEPNKTNAMGEYSNSKVAVTCTSFLAILSGYKDLWVYFAVKTGDIVTLDFKMEPK